MVSLQKCLKSFKVVCRKAKTGKADLYDGTFFQEVHFKRYFKQTQIRGKL